MTGPIGAGLPDRPAVELARLLHAGELSARELLDACLERIAATNPSKNAIVTLDAEGATAAAAAADERFAQRHGPDRTDGVLHGLPVVHKDTHVTGGMRTTWGSPLMADHVPDGDELAVARIAAAGAVRLGKSNVPEWAAGSHTTNPVFGPTHNAHRQGLSAGGSSGGAAVALACGMVPLAEGSDMGGSLRNPAAFAGVVGFRPTPGRVPSHPSLLPYQTLAVQGPLGRTVADVALLLSVLAGPDPRAPLSLGDPGSAFAPPLDADLRGLRVAWAPDLGGRIPVDPRVAAVVDAARPVWEGAGAFVEDACPDLDAADDVFSTLRAWQFLEAFGPMTEQQPEQVKETVRWNVEVGRRLTVDDLSRAFQRHGALHETVVEFFDRYDVLVCPTVQVLPFDVELEYPAEVAGVPQPDYLGWMRSCTLISAAGAPAISVPAGYTDDGLPVGLQIVGPPRADRRVLEIASAYETAAG
ncbi:amidase family protein [Pseudonocardia endophytica]|uniref:Amidase n=1 Tax=Pseudonocardia endophytica TaxID=401976 RepID=A0A4R1HSH6_PSEEN|nr:amidase family protein [Pseudonocardia endophytica]TCK25128.1 amidase [Pseudonocardia endophytica]